VLLLLLLLPLLLLSTTAGTLTCQTNYMQFSPNEPQHLPQHLTIRPCCCCYPCCYISTNVLTDILQHLPNEPQRPAPQVRHQVTWRQLQDGPATKLLGKLCMQHSARICY
jgi:hypothetical protein